MVKVIAIANQKGGVGKTTTAINLATAMVAIDKRVLIVDSDPQGNASTGLGVEERDRDPTLYRLLSQGRLEDKSIKKTAIPNLDIITATIDLAASEIELANVKNREERLKNILDKIKGYDFIVIDCPPALGLLTINSLVAADSVMVPLQCEFFALEGLTQLMKTIERIKNNLNPDLGIRGILITMYDKRNKLSSEVEKEARDYFKEKVYQTVVPRNVRLSEAPSHGVPVLIYDKTCLGSKSYFDFTEEFLNQDKILVSAA